MGDTSAGNGKVVVNRSMSLDGLVDEILVYVLPVLLGEGIRFSPRAWPE